MKKAILLAILLIFSCYGCMTAGGNLVVLKKSNLIALGSVKGESQCAVFEVTIGSPDYNFDQQFDFSIRLSSGQIIKSDEFTPELIQSIATRTNVLSSGRWGMGHVSYGVEGFSFIFQEERLVSFKAAEILLPNKTRLSASLGDANAQKFFTLPLTKGQFQYLFGEPDSEERRKVL